MTEEIQTPLISVSNFGAQNTPPLAQKIGDICLLIAGAGASLTAIVAAAPVILPAAALATLAQIGLWTAFAGTIGKTITKFFGTAEAAK